MGLLTWEWRFYIAPAPIIENKNPFTDSPKSFRHWGMFISKKTFKGFKHPFAGDVVNLPNYGPCKVERVLYWANRPSRSFTLGVVISPESIGDEEWWLQNKNHPVSKNGENWTLDFELPRSYFKDLSVPEGDFL
jgi:hypothetical protein